jgi:hypothetical protein
MCRSGRRSVHLPPKFTRHSVSATRRTVVAPAERHTEVVPRLWTDTIEAHRRAVRDAVRDDVPVDELAGYCLHALAAADTLSSPAAVRRLITVTLTGVRPAR